MARLLCVLTSLVNETPQSAKFRTRGRLLEKAAKGDDVLLRGSDGADIGYATVASVLPTGMIIALALDGLAGADVPLSTEVWLPDGDGDPGPPALPHTTNRPATPAELATLPAASRAVGVVASCPVCGAEQPAVPFAEPMRCPRCLAYLVVGDTQTREIGPNELMRTPSLLVPLPALGAPVVWPGMCACCGAPGEKSVEVPTAGSMHQSMTGGALDFVFREISTSRSLSPSWYETYRSVGAGGSGAPDAGWVFPLCGVDNADHQNPVRVWADDGALGFRAYRYFRAFCQANRLHPAG